MSAAESNLPALVETFLAEQELDMFVGGARTPAASGATVETVNPATGQAIARVPAGDVEDVDRAVRAARNAFDGAWGEMLPAERAKLLLDLADLVEADLDALATLETLDNGKPLEYARRDDIPMTAAVLRHFAGLATSAEGSTPATSVGPEYLNYTRREPLGVVGAIVPWNYPLLIATWKLAPALAAGNSVLLKPAEHTPLSALWLADLAAKAGFPDGALSVVTGIGEQAGAAIARHPGIDAVAFTGSTAVGREIVQASAGNLKRIELELGGKSPNIVFADADLPAAIEGCSDGVFYNMGQDCSAGTRIFVQEQVYEEFVDGLVEHAERRVLGDGMTPGVDQGPLVSGEQLERVLSYVAAGRAAGAAVATGGQQAAGAGLDEGYFMRPTVFTDITDDMVIAREEIFGPVVVVTSFRDVDEVYRRANDTRYGLGAGVWTRDLNQAHATARALRAGSVWVNCYNVIDPASPFGGFAESGYGKDLSRHALDNYTQVKSVWVNFGGRSICAQ
jgi:acyl-CoA reductase-like NAD-dependent aldehyde dehydrogenase